MKTKTKKLATSNTSLTDLPQFESIDITELQSCKNQVVEDYYKPDNTEWEKRVYQRVIEKIEERMLEFSSTYYELNSKLPGGSKEIISYIPKPEIHNQTKVDIGIEGWDELEIKIAIKDVVFHNRQSQRSEERYLKKLNWYKNLKIDVLRILGSEPVLKHCHFIPGSNKDKVPEWQSIKNAIQDVRNDLNSLFPDLPKYPIEHNQSKQGFTTPIKITLLDAEEYVLNMNEKLQRKVLKDIGMTYEPELDEGRRESSYVDEYEVFEEDI
jgi:hypothetical protein